VNKNHEKLAALGLPVPGEKEALAKRKAEALKEARETKKQKQIEDNWGTLCRVGTRVKVPASVFASDKTVVVPEVRPPPPSGWPHGAHIDLTLCVQCGYWVGKVTQNVDKYTNYWIKCPQEKPFWRPVVEVLAWEFLDAPQPSHPPPSNPAAPAAEPPTGEAPAGELAAAQPPTGEPPAGEFTAGESSAAEPPSEPEASAAEPSNSGKPAPSDAVDDADDNVPLSQLQIASAALLACAF